MERTSCWENMTPRATHRQRGGSHLRGSPSSLAALTVRQNKKSARLLRKIVKQDVFCHGDTSNQRPSSAHASFHSPEVNKKAGESLYSEVEKISSECVPQPCLIDSIRPGHHRL